MRHRVTFIHSKSSEEKVVNTINDTYVSLKEDMDVAREDRFTFPAPEVKNVKSLRLQVNKGYDNSRVTQPFSYPYQIGLHFYVKPLVISSVKEREEFYENSAKLIKDYFGVEPDVQTWIPSLSALYIHVQEPLAMAFKNVESSLADVNEDWSCLDYHSSDGTSSLKLFYPHAKERIVDVSNTSDFTEVGIFAIDTPSSRDNVILSGARVVMNDEPDQDLVQRTLFHVKPRHRYLEPIDLSYRPNGLHPVISFDDAPEHPVDEDIKNCILYSYYTLEKSIFLDPYQIPPGFDILANYGTKDLELPEYSIKQWGNEVLVEHKDTTTFPFDLTLHTRYQLPDAVQHKHAALDKPVVFYACEALVDPYLLNNSPFDNKRAPGGSFEKFFTDDTIFYHALRHGYFDVDIPRATFGANASNIVTLLSLILGVSIIFYKVFKKVSSQKTSNLKKTE